MVEDALIVGKIEDLQRVWGRTIGRGGYKLEERNLQPDILKVWREA